MGIPLLHETLGNPRRHQVLPAGIHTGRSNPGEWVQRLSAITTDLLKLHIWLEAIRGRCVVAFLEADPLQTPDQHISRIKGVHIVEPQIWPCSIAVLSKAQFSTEHSTCMVALLLQLPFTQPLGVPWTPLYFLSRELWQLHGETSMLVRLKTFWFHGFPFGHLGFCYYYSSHC